MKVVISKWLVDTIKALGVSFKWALFGRLCERENVIQVIALEPKLRNVELKYVGYWQRSTHRDLIPEVGVKGKVVMSFLADSILATYKGQPADVLVYDPGDYHSRHRSVAISQKLAGRKLQWLG